VSRLRLLVFRDLARVVQAAGFEWSRRRGSHNTFRSQDGKVVVIPDHGSQVITRPLLRKIIRDMGLTVEEYNDLVETIL
jgi:predicted RNA binding protein YcfA (HicA-like mRNA interferase family)